MEWEMIQSTIAEALGVDAEEITEDTAFEDLDADSLDLFEIITNLEEQLGVELPPEEAEQVRTVGDVMKLIQNA